MNTSAQRCPSLHSECVIRAVIDDLRIASAWLAATGSDHGLPVEQIMRLDQCLDEALANVIAHGGPAAHEHEVRLVFVTRSEGCRGEASVTVIDSGFAFDPLSVRQKPRPANLYDAEPGGLGLTMMRAFADALEYGRHSDRNHLTFKVCWDEPARGKQD